MPPEQWQALVRLNQEFGSDKVLQIPGYGDLETIGFGTGNAVMREAAAASPLQPLPLAVLAHGKPFSQPADAPGFAAGELERFMQAPNEDLATLVPNARFTVASESGHDIHQDQPELVIEAIQQVLEGVRNPDTWYDMLLLHEMTATSVRGVTKRRWLSDTTISRTRSDHDDSSTSALSRRKPAWRRHRHAPRERTGPRRDSGRLASGGREDDGDCRLGDERSPARVRERRARPPGVRPAGHQRVRRAGHPDVDRGHRPGRRDVAAAGRRRVGHRDPTPPRQDPDGGDSRFRHGGGGHGRHRPTRSRGGKRKPQHHL